MGPAIRLGFDWMSPFLLHRIGIVTQINLQTNQNDRAIRDLVTNLWEPTHPDVFKRIPVGYRESNEKYVRRRYASGRMPS